MENAAKKPVWRRWWFWAIAVFVLLVIASAGSNGLDATNVEDEAQNATQPTPVVDAPHLLTLTIDEAREELGPPDDKAYIDPTAEQLALGTTSWSNEFTVGDYGILLDFDVETREITEFFVETNDASGLTRDWEALLPIVGLSEDSSDYIIKPVEALKYPGKYTGVRATE